jgi:protein-tyrosine phosphatase
MCYPWRSTPWKSLGAAGFANVVCLADDQVFYNPSPLRLLHARELEDLHHGGYPTSAARQEKMVREATEIVVKSLGRGEGTIVHCIGGIGRTGTVIGCALRELGLPADQVIEYLDSAQQVIEVREQAIYDLEAGVVTDFNTIVENIANLNTQIKEEEINRNTPNELYDKRNTLIDQLSAIARIKISTTTQKISDSISVANLNIDLYDDTSGTSIALVQDGQYSMISLNTEGDTVKIELTSSIDKHDTDITNHFISGSIKGYLDVINGEGSYAGTEGNDYRGALYYLDSLNTFASTFAGTFNTLNDIDKKDDDEDPLFGASDGGETITALNITISAAWEVDSMAINAKGYEKASGDNSNALLMIEALDKDIPFKDA